MRSGIALVVGGLFITIGVLGATLPLTYSSVSAHEGHDTEHGELHEQMHQMMDAMMGEGHSEAMHEAMPGSEEMMESCAQAMEEDGMSGMGNMMHGMNHRMSDMGGMMGSRN